MERRSPGDSGRSQERGPERQLSPRSGVRIGPSPAAPLLPRRGQLWRRLTAGRGRDKIWTEGPRPGSGKVGAACAWGTREDWTGRRFHLGNNKEVFVAEVLAIYQALRIFRERQEPGRKYTVSSNSQSAIRRALSDALEPNQQWARANIEVPLRLWPGTMRSHPPRVPAHSELAGNEVADGLAKEVAEGAPIAS